MLHVNSAKNFKGISQILVVISNGIFFSNKINVIFKEVPTHELRQSKLSVIVLKISKLKSNNAL